MDSAKLFVPQRLSSTDDFEEWLYETEIKQCLTDLDMKKQGPIIYLSLEDNKRKTCSDIKVKDLNSDNDIDILMQQLKSLTMLIRLCL